MRHLAHDEAGDLDRVGLGVVGMHPVVPDVGGGHRDDLSAVGRVGQDLLVPGHPGVEHGFTEHRAGGTDAAAAEHGPVLEHEQCVSHA